MSMLRRVIFLSVLLSALATTALADPLLLTFAGDIMHHDTNAEMPDYDRLYDAVRPHLESDTLSFANIEFPVDPSQEPSGYPLFNGTVEYVQAAIRGGFDVFALANNHSFDLREAGVTATAGQFAEIETTTGTHSNGLRRTQGGPIVPTVISRDGWTIGFVSITTFSNEPGSTQFVHLVDYNRGSAAARFLEQVSEWDATFDLLIVSVHGGAEYSGSPDLPKAQFFRDIVAHGADIVWGHHPHVLQRWELVDSGSANKLIVHSAGNFVSAQRRFQQPFLPHGRWAPTGDAALFQVTVNLSDRPDRTGRLQPTVLQVKTPMFTTHMDPQHGMILKTYGSVLTDPLPLAWRAFYAARYSSTRSLLNTPLSSLLIRRIAP